MKCISKHLQLYSGSLKDLIYDFMFFFTIKIFTLNVPFGALMVFSGCSIPSIGRAGCSASIHGQTALMHHLQAVSGKSMCLRMMKLVYTVAAT